MTDEDQGRRAFLRGGILRGLGRKTSAATPAASTRAKASAARRAEATEAIELALRRVGSPAGHAPVVAASSVVSRPPLPLIRPPGAVDEVTFLERCKSGCDDCARACPVQAIAPAGQRMRGAVGTPVLAPSRVPCTGCPEFDVPPCIAACPTGALDRRGSPRIGIAHVFADGCLAHRHLVCTTCRERCPIEGAIVFQAGRPKVQERLCVGCGNCAYTCPAPGLASDVLPLRARPTPAPDADADNAAFKRPSMIDQGDEA